MAILEDDQRNIVIGVVAGVVAAGLAKYVTPAFNGVGRPLLKGIIKTGLSTYDAGRVKFAEASEVVEDLVAEARAELDAEAAETAKTADAGHVYETRPEETRPEETRSNETRSNETRSDETRADRRTNGGE
jgi:hypothetical protein